MSQLPIGPPSLSFINQHLMTYNSSGRSGIIERHTYKTDSGKVLRQTPSNAPTSSPTKASTSSITNTSLGSTSVAPERRNSLPYLPSNTVLFRSKTKMNNRSQEKNKDVRTEHCDSTTDIIEHVNHSSSTTSDLHIDHQYTRDNHTAKSNKEDSSNTIHIDSDSDCEIVDYNNIQTLSIEKTRICLSFMDKDNIPTMLKQVVSTDPVKSKVLAWFADTEKLTGSKSLSETVVISDSEEETKDTNKIEAIVDAYSNLDTKNSRVVNKHELDNIAPSTSDKNDSPSSSVQEIHLHRSPSFQYEPTCQKEKTPTREVAVSPIIVKDCTPVQNKISEPSPVIPAEKTPPKQKTPIKERAYVPPSPDTAKTELYSYLKINTNPAAQKTETVKQHRRSNRVKNLTKQIEKAKEVNNISNAPQVDVRKKYMKYSKALLDFQSTVKYIPTTVMYFDMYITNYFRSENIDYLQESMVRANATEQPAKRKRADSEVEQVVHKKVKYVKHAPARASKKQARKKLLEIRKLKASNLNYPVAMNKTRFRSRRNLRSTLSRITRKTIDDIKMFSQKMLKISRARLKCRLDKMKKIKRAQVSRESETVNEESSSSNKINYETKENIQNNTTTAMEEKINDSVVTPNNTRKEISDPVSSIVTVENVTPINVKDNVSITLPQMNGTSASSSIITQNISFSFDKPEQSGSIPKENSQIVNLIEVKNTLPQTSNNSVLQSYLANEPINNNIHTTITNIQTQLKNTNNEFSNKAITAPSTPEPLVSESPDCIGFEQDTSQMPQIPDVDGESYKSADSEKNLESSNKSVTSAASSREDNDNFTDDQNSNSSSEPQNEIQSDTITKNNPNYIPLNRNIKSKSFHKSLLENTVKRKSNFDIVEKSSLFELSDSDSSLNSPKSKSSPIKKTQTHVIDISECNGSVFNAYYVHNMLIIVQTQLITFWKQTALGNILGVQTMWIPSGNLQRIVLDSGCVNQRSSEMTLNVDNSIAYIELWTKEHKCQYRECPIADVFATVYFYKGHGQPDKKVLQLENIKGYGSDVRFAVTKCSRSIVVSWCDRFSKPTKTLVRCYELAADFQVVSSVKEMESVSHYISSLHNIQGCENLVLGADNDKVSIWNLTHGYLVITLNLSETEIPVPLKTRTICLYAQCDSGFLFLVQQINVGLLRLVAVNGITHEWKQLHSYEVPTCYEKLLGVIVESGVLMTCYTNGVLCWNMHSGQIIAEIDTSNDQVVLPCNKHVVVIKNYNVTVQHVLSYVLTHDW